MAVPVIAEKNTLLTITTKANPPGIGPTMILENSINRLDIPPLAIISPANMNNGIATRVKLFTPLKIFLGTFVNRLTSFAAIPIIEINAIENAIGTLIIISTNNSMIKPNQSIFYTASSYKYKSYKWRRLALPCTNMLFGLAMKIVYDQS